MTQIDTHFHVLTFPPKQKDAALERNNIFNNTFKFVRIEF